MTFKAKSARSTATPVEIGGSMLYFVHLLESSWTWFWTMVVLGLSLKFEDWIWITKYDMMQHA